MIQERQGFLIVFNGASFLAKVVILPRKKLLEMSVLLDHPVQFLNHAGLFFVIHFSSV